MNNHRLSLNSNNEIIIYVSLRLCVQNAVAAQPLCWKVGNISGSTELFAL